MEKQKIALVLGAGGARGIAHIGIIEEFLRRGYEITSVAGTSMGALVAGAFAAGHLETFKQWISQLDRRKIFSLMDFSLRGDGLINGTRFLNHMKKLIPDVRIDKLPIHFTAIAADWISGREVVMDSGMMYDAIHASIAIPALCRPVAVGDQLLIDGGVVNPLPVNRVHRTEGDVLVAIHACAGFSEPYEKRVKYSRNFYKLLISSSQIFQQSIARLTLQQCPPDLFIKLEADTYGIFEMLRAKEIIEYGRTIAGKALDEFEEKLRRKQAGEDLSREEYAFTGDYGMSSDFRKNKPNEDLSSEEQTA